MRIRGALVLHPFQGAVSAAAIHEVDGRPIAVRPRVKKIQRQRPLQLPQPILGCSAKGDGQTWILGGI